MKMHRRRLEHWQVIALCMVAYDALAVNLAYFLALWLRFDLRMSQIPPEYTYAWGRFAPWYTFFCISAFWILHLYNSIWRFASYNELGRIISSTLITGAFHTVGITIFLQRMPISYYLMGPVLQFILVAGLRFSYRFLLLLKKHPAEAQKAAGGRGPRILLVGGGEAGQMLIRDIRGAKEVNGQVVCIIDDNPNKWNRYIDGIPVVGGRDDIIGAVSKYDVDRIYLAIPSASALDRADILNICKETGCELKVLPGMYQLVNGEVSLQQMKEPAIEDLLGREPVSIDLTEIYRFISGKVILVTGGGGSIGSELCRQIAAHGPARLIIFDIYENNAYDIQQELGRSYPDLKLTVLIGSVRDSRRLSQIFSEYRPDVVYHAAAHKHVPLMEDSPNEAIKNNVIGTYKTAYAAMLYGASRFVLISTDKAVNPTNIMGASKRLCEMIVQTFDYMVKEGRAGELPQLFDHLETEEKMPAPPADVSTTYVAVRFGNVLGSNGSVIPLFKKQIAEGGPVTVTHKDIIRYFMTIPEAVSLVLQASVMGEGSEIFVLDMGEPVRIDTLARNLIKLSGYKPDEDIRIVYTGLRPGEKLYEEKLMAEEGLRTTQNRLIHIGVPVAFDYSGFTGQLAGLLQASNENSDEIRELVGEVVTTYHPEKAGVPEEDAGDAGASPKSAPDEKKQQEKP